MSCHVSISHATCAPNYKHISPCIFIISFSFCVLVRVHFLCLPACNAGALSLFLVSNTQKHMKHDINQAPAYIRNSIYIHRYVYIKFPTPEYGNREDFLKQFPCHSIQFKT